MLGPERCAVKAQTTRQVCRDGADDESTEDVRRDGADEQRRRCMCRDGANLTLSLHLSDTHSLSLSLSRSAAPAELPVIFAVAASVASQPSPGSANKSVVDFGGRLQN